MDSEFADRLALVTGGAQGIGAALSEELVKLNTSVVMVDVNATKVEEVAVVLRQRGGNAYPYSCDLRCDEAVEQLGVRVIAQHGVPDLIFNNAYVPILGGIENIVMDDWRMAFEVNVFGYVRIIKAFVGAMVERGTGHVMNTASPMGIMPDLFGAANMLPYCSSKAADIGLSSALAAALHPHGISVSVFFPDITNTWTGQARGAVSPQFTEALGRLIQSGTSAHSAALAMLDGIRSGKYLVSAEAGFEERLVQGAMTGFDPRATDRGITVPD